MRCQHINNDFLPFLKKYDQNTEYHVWDFFYKNGEIVGSPHTKRLPSLRGKKDKTPTYTSQEILQIKNAHSRFHLPTVARRHHLSYLPHPKHKAKDGEYLASLIAPVFEEELIRNWIKENSKEDQIELYSTRRKVKPYNETGKPFAPYKDLNYHGHWFTLQDFFEDYKELDVNFLNLFIPQQKCYSAYGLPFYALPNLDGQLYVRVYKYGIDKRHLLTRLEKRIKK